MSYSGKFKDKNNNLHPVTSVLYGTCDTAAATAAKVVTCTDFDTLMTGVTIRVKFANANTAASPTVNINSTGAKSVYRFGSTAPVDGNSWNAGEVVELVYDGTSFFMTGADDISVKQNVNDNSLETTDKTIVGAINEHEGDIDSLKSGLTDLSDHVDGDATTYPYADVITINDAVPANLADCSVKIEPVQDLHGYGHPWVGGAGKNKAEISNATLAGTIRTADIPSGTVTMSGTTSESGYGPTVLWGQKLQEGTYILSAESFTGTGYSILKGWDYYANLDINGTTIEADGTSTYRIAKYVASGANVDVTITGLMIRLATETDATFAPYTNICPISGHTEAVVTREGVNIFNPNALETFDVNGEGAIRTGHRFKEVKKYIVNNINNGNIFGRLVKTDLSEYGQYVTILPNTYASFTVTEGYMLYVYYEAVSGMSAENICVKYGEDTTFIAYEGQQYTLALGDTIYGGTVDFDSGAMTVDRAVVDLGTLNYTYNSTDIWFKAPVSNIKLGDVRTLTMLCECYQCIDDGRPFANVPDSAVWNGGMSGEVYIRDTRYTDPTDLDTALDGMKLIYPIATPTTIQLTPTQIQLLQGKNTLTASTGDISVTVNGVAGSIGAVQEQVNEIAGDVDDHEERIEVVESGLTNKIDGIFVPVTTDDGRYCTITFSNIDVTRRTVFAILIGSALAETKLALCKAYADNNAPAISSDDQSVSFNASTMTLTIDVGTNAWTRALILAPSGLFTVSS